MTRKRVSFVLTFALVLAAVACDRKETPATNGVSTNAPATADLPADLFVTTSPPNAKTVEEMKASAKVGDTVVVRGRVGGSKEPFVEGRAMFTLMGNGLKACSDNADDECSTPWDYCCDTAEDIAKHSATIQVVDSNGAPIKSDIKGRSAAKELSELVVVGKIVQAGEKTTVIAATSIHVAKP